MPTDGSLVTLAHRLFQIAPGFACILRGADHVFEFANDGFYDLVGQRPLIGKPVRVAFPHPELEELIRLLDQVYRTRRPYAGRAVQLLVRRGPDAPPEERFLDLSYLPIPGPDDDAAGILAQGYEVTELVRAQQALHASEQRLHLALEAAGEGVWDWNIADGRFSFSERGRDMLGYGPGDIGARLEDWVAITHPDDMQRLQDETMACVRGRVPTVLLEYRVRNRQGDWQWILARGAVVERSPEGRALRMMGTTVDISGELETLHRANFDTLTGLANRALFREQLEHEVELSRRNGRPLALFFIDLDRFKEINDLFGHDAGDALLCEAAERIRDCVRKSDMAARLSGDEFTVILTELDSATHASGVAQKILHALARPFDLDGKEVSISGSIGITLFPADAAGTGDLLRNADQAMYAAKKAGRNQFRFFTPAMQEDATRRLALLRELREALPKRQLQVVFQPIVELAGGRIVKAEALLRWQHPERGLLRPAAFMAQAEESGLISEIGHWVFSEAAAWARRWTEQTGATFQVSINRSPVEFAAHAQAPDWEALLRDLGLAWHSLSVDITEALLLKPSLAVENGLLQLRQSGIQVSIDGFGSGYSSLASVKKYDVDFLKIDQSFVREADTPGNARTIAETIVLMAHKLGLRVVAEGVETAQQRDWLRAAGCDYAQGYLFSEPLPPEGFSALLAAQGRA
ncbi:hypothetical protein NCCP691_17880 [Noviherbaspirillum aridicola]|uniref:PAS domain S-box-containing protein/diguanylate cyclase (GGDEF)-like protein n=1 Tax=Noviherbaspirillum aridicola TaxID=2849687 RepID=A0ABQ4Q3T7_9BURK|nr:hypothetical protein NCCP691_17880 [Noviherbaspirillum aridicola]